MNIGIENVAKWGSRLLLVVPFCNNVQRTNLTHGRDLVAQVLRHPNLLSKGVAVDRPLAIMLWCPIMSTGRITGKVHGIWQCQAQN